MNTNNTAAPSVTIAPRNPARGILTFVVTLTTSQDVRSYPCRSLQSATKLAERFSQITQRDTEFAVKTILDAMSDALLLTCWSKKA